ncbi:hypothetical protein FR943_02480 [Mycobacterium sp. TNTM28]|uniref:Uncharacterized protein n=1 Tax=[Mycobacterium] fortunisiensis TaxID=2600579 RepID=A0ABS6KGP4_9MYCO|nr:hypothetical protein [[Mycobacterium] fortunisiensis]MBU9762720.1 hypothetical protein [[Mycobacterium] fortunisiensis]
MSSDSGYLHPELEPAEHAACREAARRQLELATRAEPATSEAVTSIITTHGGAVERFGTRLKCLESLDRKTQTAMARNIKVEGFGGCAEDIVAEIGDVLRYTAVLPDREYWSCGTRIINALIRAGYRPNELSDGWVVGGYRGRNCSFVGSSGIEFEVQFHTRDSLAAAEDSHGDYELARDDATPEPIRATALRRLRATFALVPAPADIRWVD